MATELEINLIQRIAIGDIFRRRAKDCAQQEAIVEFHNGQRIATTYQSLNEQINQFVNALRGLGASKGDRIGILGENTSSFLVALIGTYKAGCVAVPINYLQGVDDLSYVIDHSGAEILVVDSKLHEKVGPIVDGINREFQLISLDENSEQRDDRFQAFASLLDGQPKDEVEDVIIEDNDIAQIMYTSGTTSRPKGAMSSNKAMYMVTLNTSIAMGVMPGQANQLIVLPLFHITAITYALTTLHLGSKMVLLRGFMAEQTLSLVESEQLNCMVLLPLMWRAVLDSPELSQHDYSSMSRGIYGMAPMDAVTLNTLRETFGCPFITGSGQTEMTGTCTSLDAKWVGVKEGNYWGDGSTCCDQAVMDDNGNLLPQGEVGEIVWRGPQTMSGYFNNQEATDEVQAFGWHHSGDLGYEDEDNQMRFVDRKKDIVKSGGENVSSVLVESTVLAVEGVANVAVIGVPHQRWGEAIVAVVLPEPGSNLDEDTVIQACKSELGGFQVPKRVMFRESFPMTATGKVKKPELRLEYEGLFDEG